MASIKWQASVQDPKPPVQDTSGTNLWFAITIGLIGIIVGFILGNLL